MTDGMKTMIARLSAKNPGVAFHSADSEEFSRYGRVLRGIDTAGLVGCLKRSSELGDGVEYRRSVTPLEDETGPRAADRGGAEAQAETWKRYLELTVFGGVPVQIGWCVGRNSRLNALEYHKSSEVLVAGSDLLLLLGKVEDIKDHSSYDASLVRAFLVGEGQAVETWSATLHFAPIMTAPSGFRAAIALPAGTNAPLDRLDAAAGGEEGLLRAVNKWLIACPGSTPARKGARAGIDRNIEISV